MGNTLVIAHRFQADFGCNDGMGRRIYGQVKLAPDAAFSPCRACEFFHSPSP